MRVVKTIGLALVGVMSVGQVAHAGWGLEDLDPTNPDSDLYGNDGVIEQVSPAVLPSPAEVWEEVPSFPSSNEGEGATTPGFTSRRYEDFWIDNQIGQAVNNIYLSPSRSTDWGEDILGSGILQNGGSFNTRVESYGIDCKYDIMAIMADGSEFRSDNIDACAMGGIFIERNY